MPEPTDPDLQVHDRAPALKGARGCDGPALPPRNVPGLRSRPPTPPQNLEPISSSATGLSGVSQRGDPFPWRMR